jgi:hypothetical protein
MEFSCLLLIGKRQIQYLSYIKLYNRFERQGYLQIVICLPDTYNPNTSIEFCKLNAIMYFSIARVILSTT